ncbi:hypothetical protein ACFO4O_01870 [Glaciecola siphonariae]|uniref:Uncharacterized protein n=1 Tax=Glaciecola siphonariae TaxID=521012 RepID=A0ABV9LQX8_9ALTE
MYQYQFICKFHQQWAKDNPLCAFKFFVPMSKDAANIVKDKGWDNALPHIGSAYETADILFTQAPESGQITTMYTSLAILLAKGYYSLGCPIKAEQTLDHVKQRILNQAWLSQTCRYQHCIACLEQAMQHNHIASKMPCAASQQHVALH